MEYTPRPRPTGTNELKAELVRSAAFVAHEGRKAKQLAGWLTAEDDRHVLYVFDTDIIVSHCAPWRSGPVDDVFLGRGYGQILPPKPYDDDSPQNRQTALFEEKRRAEAVCWLLADKALRNALRHQPILQLGSHFDETLRVYEAVKADAKSEPVFTRSTIQERQDHIVNQTLQFVSRSVQSEAWPLEVNPGHFLSTVLNRIQLRDLQRSSPFIREWDGFSNLNSRYGGIFELSEFRPAADALTLRQRETWSHVCDEFRTHEQQAEWTELYNILSKIVAPDRYQHSRERLKVDTSALADLAFVNRILASVDAALKVVLVTGDRKMVLALAAAQETLGGSWGEKMVQFAIDHVHHLWSFVDRIGADIADNEGNNGHRSELFSGFLAFDGDEYSDPDLTRLARYAIQPDSSLIGGLQNQDIDQAYHRWTDFSQGAANLHRYFLDGGKNIDAISEILIGKLKLSNPDWTHSRIRALVQETIARARDRSNVEFSGIGANSILDAHKNGVRNPPDLMFDSLKVTDRIFKDLAAPKRIFQDADDFAKRFERIVDDCYQPKLGSVVDDDYRQECYLKYLVLGALFASANRWLVAEQHAENAVKIVERSRLLKDPLRTRPSPDNLRSHMSGREAYYLLAVSTRVRANGDKAFNDAQRALTEARNRLAEDRRVMTGQGVPFIRFDSEDLELALARYYHARSRDDNEPANGLADRVFEKTLVLLQERDAMGKRDAVAEAPPGDKLSYLSPSTRANIATNILQVAIIARFRTASAYFGRETSPIDIALISSELGTLIDYTSLSAELDHLRYNRKLSPASSDADVICSPLMMRYAAAAAMITNDSRIWHPRTKGDVELLFRDRRMGITSYDEWRYDMLRRFALRALLP
ncbi:hypothetical protein [Bradyrhizobium sp. RT5a]|uniref:hypothetical protein n=1 Tax=unclassified Bradyrhizobium TaxID=2631580 RepID=UPI0033965403